MTRSIPDALTYARVVLTVATFGVALARHEAAFTARVLTIVLTDVLDGPLARRKGRTTRRGANLDSAADFLFYASLPAWVYLFQPAVMVALLPFIIVFALGYVSANVLSRVRRGVIGFHNRWTRAAAFLGVVTAIWTVLWGLDPFLFWAILALMTLDLAQRFVGIARATPPPEESGARKAAAAGAARSDGDE